MRLTASMVAVACRATGRAGEADEEADVAAAGIAKDADESGNTSTTSADVAEGEA